MQARPIILAALAVSALTAFAGGPPLTTKYRVEVMRSSHVDLSAVGQPPRDQSQSTTAFVSLSLSDTVGGRVLGLLIDSVQVDTALQVPQAMLDSVKGATASVLLSAANRPSAIRPEHQTVLADGIFPLLNHFYPRTPAKTKVGDHWTDTLEFAAPQGPNASVTVKMVANWVVMGDEAKDGQKARKVQEAYSIAQNGQLSGPQGDLTLAGTGTGSATYWLASDGHLIAQQSAESLSSTITSPALPGPLPVMSKTTVTAAVVK